MQKESTYRTKIVDLLEHAENYHNFYYQTEIFTGPSLYFHKRSLDTRYFEQNDAAFEKHLEYIYATLASWGMHRMGPGGPKMKPFDIFKNSVSAMKDKIGAAQKISPDSITQSDFDNLKDIFMTIKVMESKTSIIGNSKVMAHMLPNVIPPIDREYTLIFLKNNKNIKNDLEIEWQITKEFLTEFFIPVVVSNKFRETSKTWLKDNIRFPWDTSPLKIVDNLIIGAVRKRK